MRQSPHLNDELTWLFFTQFQLDLEVGVGAVTGHQLPHGEPGVEGVNLTLMLQWSDDGGHTWSDERWIDAGHLGTYQHRAIWRRLGRARTRTWRVIMTDPVEWHLIDAFVQASKGTS
jgi:hypothetical protein